MLTAQPINGLIYTHEEIKKHKPHHYPRRNNTQITRGQLSVTVSSDEDQTPEQLAHLTLYCPVCNRDGKVENGRCTKVDGGYYYMITHRNGKKCVIIQQRHRDKVLEQIKKGAYKKDVGDPCLRYLMTMDQEILDDLFYRDQSSIQKEEFYSFKS